MIATWKKLLPENNSVMIVINTFVAVDVMCKRMEDAHTKL